MPSTIETGHRSFASPVDAEQIGRALLCDPSATEEQLLHTAACMIGTSVGGHNRAARIAGVAAQLTERAHRRMILRAARAAVRDHAPSDPYATEQRVTVAQLINGRTDLDAAKDRVWEAQHNRAHPAPWRDERRRSVAEAVRSARIVGTATDNDPEWAQHRDEIVIDVTYGERAGAVYAVAPDSSPVLWID